MLSYRRSHEWILLVFSSYSLLTFATARVFGSASTLEPFVSYSKSDPFYYVGVSAALLIFWVELDILVIVGVGIRRLSAWWLFGILWSIIGIACACSAAGTWTGGMEYHLPRNVAR